MIPKCKLNNELYRKLEYDKINETLYQKHKEKDLAFINFYYYNMQKNKEEYEAEIQ